MGKIIITESQFKKLYETGSNSAAMDLDIYTQINPVSTDNGNLDTEDSLDMMVEKMEELISMIKTGKQVPTQVRSEIHGVLDTIDKIYNKIKYDE
jgi:translation elongation factor P/translation initiation factor 5A